jgi:short-subunit dehydrogenase
MTPYSVSKFAVLSLSENLEIELRSRGESIGVSLLVPGPTRTRMNDSERNRPADVPPSANPEVREPIAAQVAEKFDQIAIDPAQTAEMVFAAVAENRFYVLTHPQPALDSLDQRRSWMLGGEPPPVRSFESVAKG